MTVQHRNGPVLREPFQMNNVVHIKIGDENGSKKAQEK
jgi:hypothetical protein